MTPPSADVHLKRAYRLIKEVEGATEEFRQAAISFDSRVERDPGFGMVSMLKANRQLERHKASLLNDLQLASQEIDRAVGLDQDATIDTGEGKLGALELRALITYFHGLLEMIWGRRKEAKRLLNNCSQMVEFPHAHYMLGLLHEADYESAEALKHFERCLELDPSGELSTSALREANEMRNYRKKFRGSWLLLILLLIYGIIPGIIYFRMKYK